MTTQILSFWWLSFFPPYIIACIYFYSTRSAAHCTETLTLFVDKSDLMIDDDDNTDAVDDTLQGFKEEGAQSDHVQRFITEQARLRGALRNNLC